MPIPSNSHKDVRDEKKANGVKCVHGIKFKVELAKLVKLVLLVRFDLNIQNYQELSCWISLNINVELFNIKENKG